MGSHRPNVVDNPPASAFPLRGHNEFGLGCNEASDWTGITAGADLNPFPYISLPVAPSAWEDMHATHQSRNHGNHEASRNLMANITSLSSIQNAHSEPNTIILRSNRTSVPSRSQLSFPEQNIRGMNQSVNCDYMVTPNDVMNGCSDGGGFQNPQENRNVILTRDNAAGGYQMTRHGGEARNWDINMQQMNDNYFRVGGSAPILLHVRKSGEIATDNHVKVSADQSDYGEKIDGSFLSLGIGGNQESRSRPFFSSREISRELTEVFSPKPNTSCVRQTTRSSSSQGRNIGEQTMVSGLNNFPSSQNSAGGYSSPAFAGWMLSNNDVGVTRGANTVQQSLPCRNLHAQQVDMQQSAPISRNSDFMRNRDVRCADEDPYRVFEGGQAASSGAVSTNSAGFLCSRQTGLSRLASDSANQEWITPQSDTEQLQRCNRRTSNNFSSVPSLNSPLRGLRGSSARQDHSGMNQTTKTSLMVYLVRPAASLVVFKILVFELRGLIEFETTCNSPCWFYLITGHIFAADGRSRAQARGNLLPKKVGDQVTEGSAVQAAIGGMFPKRLGVQFNNDRSAQAAGGDLLPQGMGIHIAGQYQEGVPVQLSKEHWRPVSNTGQLIPSARVNGLSQASDTRLQPTVKRSANRTPSAAPRAVRRKIAPQFSFPPKAFPLQSAPDDIPVPAHIKWQGSDGPPQPTGQKCSICKRDLSFTAEGLLDQPSVPPSVAVLPCGHTFHDQCLNRITPEDQSKNPPCIPCAIGEG
ncbi:hypothetical protein RJ639_010528 [Escallonia herrerae]|uniref:RING-type domain-containing protein n=1 Tax=Escallonia herrerae TaxID=1293975 RepID=A0AA89AR05_9ASTE|nr:hypothetical protein RJ639_010528 [Escallonia herrerae]